MIELAVDVAGLRLRNPTILASGILNESGKSMLEVARAGAGALVTKSIGLDEREGHSNPCIVEVESGIINAMGLPNPGVDAYAAELKEARGGEVPVIASVIGGDAGEIAEAAKAMTAAGADAIELNLSCPHAKGLGAEIGSTPENVAEVCRATKRAVSVPVFAKLTPNTSSFSIRSLRAFDAISNSGTLGISTVSSHQSSVISSRQSPVDFIRPLLTLDDLQVGSGGAGDGQPYLRMLCED